MPIIAIVSQPGNNSKLAYAPIEFTVLATNITNGPVPPVVFADIYFDGVYYKTISHSQPDKINSTNSEWIFDISGVCQEAMGFDLPPINGNLIIDSVKAYRLVTVKFRSSGINSSGFLQTDGTAPIQGTGSQSPVSGSGMESSPFHVINTAFQGWEVQDIQANLDSLKVGQWYPLALPLSHRPKLSLAPQDSDYFPYFYNAYIQAGVQKMKLFYRFTGQDTWREIVANIIQVDGNIFLVPNGPRNLASLFPAVNWAFVEEYYMQTLSSTGTILASFPHVTMSKPYDDKIRIAFINFAGVLDAVNMKVTKKEHSSKSDEFTRRVNGPGDVNHSVNKTNIESGDIFTAITVEFNEKEVAWLSEMADSPAAWIVTPERYVPIVILDGKNVLVKEDDRFTYEFEISYTYSAKYINLRG